MQPTGKMKPLSGPHQKFAEGIAKGLNATEAYCEAYPKSTKAAARRSASDLLTNPDIAREIENIRKAASEVPGSAKLTIAEKRDFIARLVKAKVSEISASSDLWQSVKQNEFGIEYKLPGKLEAIKLDNDLAGEGSEATAADALAGLLGRIRKGRRTS
jgi:hypothetical protein